MGEDMSVAARVATSGKADGVGPVTLINGFVVAPQRDEVFRSLWAQTSEYFAAQPGFLSLRLHRAVTPSAQHRYVNVATWASAQQFREAHATDSFRRLVSQPGWQEFPNSPALYEVVIQSGAEQ